MASLIIKRGHFVQNVALDLAGLLNLDADKLYAVRIALLSGGGNAVLGNDSGVTTSTGVALTGFNMRGGDSLYGINDYSGGSDFSLVAWEVGRDSGPTSPITVTW